MKLLLLLGKKVDISFFELKADSAKKTAAALTGELLQNPNVLAAFTDKLGSMVGKPSGYIDRSECQLSGSFFILQ